MDIANSAVPIVGLDDDVGNVFESYAINDPTQRHGLGRDESWLIPPHKIRQPSAFGKTFEPNAVPSELAVEAETSADLAVSEIGGRST